jgi:hypothetical protein
MCVCVCVCVCARALLIYSILLSLHLHALFVCLVFQDFPISLGFYLLLISVLLHNTESVIFSISQKPLLPPVASFLLLTTSLYPQLCRRLLAPIQAERRPPICCVSPHNVLKTCFSGCHLVMDRGYNFLKNVSYSVKQCCDVS